MSKLAAYAGVARAPFLLLPVTLVASGAAAAAYDDRAFVLATLLALVGMVALHAAVNAFNEASDMRSGIDLQTTRTPFSGGSGTLPSGALPVGGAVAVGVAGSVVGLAIGIYFGTRVGWWPLGGVMAIGAVAVLIYTEVFARSAAGEIFAGLGLGLLPVVGTALVQRGEVGPAAWAAGVPAFLMTFNLLLLNEFPDEKADRAGGRLNLVLLAGRRRAALLYVAAAVATPAAIAVAVVAAWLPPLALIGCLPIWFALPAIRWALSRSHEPVPIPAMAGNVIWNLATNTMLAAGVGLAAYLGR
ncbi:MAG TPA: prenyltransferase [Vicinamibacterales bacterium]|nr:prenyltransferase [Vicinamibacterales bacterium]